MKPKRYHIHVASPGHPLRQARTKIGAQIKARWLRALTFGLKTVTVTDTVTGAVIERG